MLWLLLFVFKCRVVSLYLVFVFDFGCLWIFYAQLFESYCVWNWMSLAFFECYIIQIQIHIQRHYSNTNTYYNILFKHKYTLLKHRCWFQTLYSNTEVDFKHITQTPKTIIQTRKVSLSKTHTISPNCRDLFKRWSRSSCTLLHFCWQNIQKTENSA